MNKKKYFQKGVLVLIITMLLTISNMHIYSSVVGSYKISSKAIEVSNGHHKAEKPSLGFAASVALASLGVSVAAFFGIIALSVYIGTHASHGSAKQHTLVCSSVVENYDKYDFSQFDN